MTILEQLHLLILRPGRLKVSLMGLLCYGEEQLPQKYSYPHG